jgi:sugar phosphate permease
MKAKKASRFGRWHIFLVLTGMYVIAYFYRVSAAVIAGDLAVDLSLSPWQLGNVSAALFYAFALAQLPLGPILDRVGPRKTIFALGLVTAVGALVFARAAGYGEALVGRTLIGVGSACVLMGSLKTYTAWFSPRQFATLAGMQVALGNVGNLLATAPLAWLAATVGWRGTFTAFALLTAIAAWAVLAVVRDAPVSGVAGGGEGMPLLAGWKMLAGTPSFWSLSLLAFFWYGSYMAVQGLWGGPYLMTVLGLDRPAAARLLLLTATGFIVGCPLAGRLSDCLASRKKVLLIGQLGLLAEISLFLGPLEILPSWLLPVVFFLFGICVSSGPVLYAQVKELFPPALSATAMTGVNFFVVMGAALTQQLMGHVLGPLPVPGADAAALAFHKAFAVPLAGLGLAWLGYLFCCDTRPSKGGP